MISTESYKGVRDFYPEDQFIQNYIFNVWRKTVESFGYVEYSASILEPTELYKAKSGEEIVNEQTYSFIDRGERDVTLRPEMTPTVARMIAAKRNQLSSPTRWYSIPNLFRYERPQRGRLREHWQLNADIFGVKGIEAEIEMISMAYQIMRNFGLTDDKFEIRINSRKLLFDRIESKLINPEYYSKALKLLDKHRKISPEAFAEGWTKLSSENFELNTTPNDEIQDLITRLNTIGITNAVYDPVMVRGFDYYTDIVFEIFDKNPENNRSLFGGGRYDDLLGIFGIASIPTVGFGMGDVTMKDTLETYGLLPTYASSTHLYLCSMNDGAREAATKLAERLRGQGVNVAVDYSERKIGDQIKKAVKDSIPFIICIGDDELTTGSYKIKTLATEEETPVKEEEIASFITYRQTHK